MSTLNTADLAPLLALVAAFDDVADDADDVGISAALRQHGCVVADPDVDGAPRLRAFVEEVVRIVRRTDPRRRAAGIDGLLDRLDVRLAVGSWAGFARLQARTPGKDRVGRLLAACAVALAVAMTEFDDRLRACDELTCDEIFVDATRNHSGRFCSRTCSNRHHARVHRERHRW